MIFYLLNSRFDTPFITFSFDLKIFRFLNYDTLYLNSFWFTSLHSPTPLVRVISFVTKFLYKLGFRVLPFPPIGRGHYRKTNIFTHFKGLLSPRHR